MQYIYTLTVGQDVFRDNTWTSMHALCQWTSMDLISDRLLAYATTPY
jgi:hypothetical protein